MLTFEDVEHHVSCLPVDVIDVLARGPIEEAEDVERGLETEGCRVCEALVPLLQTPSRAALHAKELYAWHDQRTEGLKALRAVAADRDAMRLVQELHGSLCYARGCTIYALARALLAARHGTGWATWT